MISVTRPAPAAVTVTAPAKINLQLAVGPAQADGYHALVTVLHAVSLLDEVTVRPASQMSIGVTGEDAGLVPAIVQDSESGDVLMMAWMDEPAIRQTLATGQTHFYSRSRKASRTLFNTRL